MLPVGCSADLGTLPSFIYSRGRDTSQLQDRSSSKITGRVLVGSQRNHSKSPILFSLRVASWRVPRDLPDKPPSSS
jgi:hypothetical protein